ncbi:MAG: aminotransferase class I/II-fold pyridoxal phosphate-dependent enzyme, partial [Bacteroidales bacterium]|nr:aminotransferase class I/II-fold pyridoxal phosphate-dependent enzyme [Bacteroidales bacterium]
VVKVKSNIDCGQFKPKQLATIVALDTPMQWHDNMNLLYEQRRLWVYKILSIMGCTYSTNQVGFFVWAKIPDHEKSSKDLVNDLFYKARVFVTPGFIYGSNGDRYIRMSLGSSASNIKEAYERIADFLVSRSQ